MKNFNEYLKEIGFNPLTSPKLKQSVAMRDEEDGVLMDYNDFAWYILVSESFRKYVYIESITDKEIILIRLTDEELKNEYRRIKKGIRKTDNK